MAEIRTQRPPNHQTSNPKQVATVTWARGHHPENDGVCVYTPTRVPESGCAFSPSGEVSFHKGFPVWSNMGFTLKGFNQDLMDFKVWENFDNTVPRCEQIYFPNNQH